MQDFNVSLKKANSEREEKRKEMMKIGHYQKLLKFLEARFESGETYSVQNYFENYKLETTDQEGNKKIVYGLIVNDKTYLSLNDISFPKKLYIKVSYKEDDREISTYTQLDKKVYQGDLAILFAKFKSIYKDALTAFDLLYVALAKHNDSKFVAESFVYPTNTFQCFKGEYTNSNFYLFNLKAGGTDESELDEIIASVCAVYDASTAETSAEE